jgi:hypothetical protein
MAILNSVSTILLGMGSGSTYKSAKATLATGATSNTLTLTPAQPISRGIVRVQAKGYTGGGGFVSCSMRGSDGTNFWDLGYIVPAAAGTAGDFISLLQDFIVDGPGLTSIVVILNLTAATTGGTTAIDAEVWGA